MPSITFFILLITLLNVSYLNAQKQCSNGIEGSVSTQKEKIYFDHFSQPEFAEQPAARRTTDMFERTGVTYEFSSPEDSVLVQKEVIRYDENGNALRWISYNWIDSDQSWRPGYKRIAWFNEDNKRVVQFRFIWSSQLGDWEKSFKEDYEYSDTLDRYTCYHWEDSIQDWVNQCRLESYYNEKHERILSRSLGWEARINEWNLYRYTNFAYDEIGLKTNTSYAEDHTTGEILPDYKRIRISKTLNPKVEEHYDWNGKLEDWILNNKYESHYNISGDLIAEQGYTFDSLLASFYLRHQREIIYTDSLKTVISLSMDASQYIIRGYKEFIKYDDQDREVLYSLYEWDTLQHTFMRDSKNFYSYNYDLVTELKKNVYDQIVLFPNPTGSVIKISGIKPDQIVLLHATSSSKLFIKQLKGSLLDFSDMKTGMYILIIKDHNNQSVKRKVVKY